jgi:hypothetical protein
MPVSFAAFHDTTHDTQVAFRQIVAFSKWVCQRPRSPVPLVEEAREITKIVNSYGQKVAHVTRRLCFMHYFALRHASPLQLIAYYKGNQFRQ